VTNLGVNEGEPKLLQREYLQRANLPEKNILQGRERLKRSEKKQKFCGSTQAPLAAWGLHCLVMYSELSKSTVISPLLMGMLDGIVSNI
jgi:hypothetical protein